MTRNKHPQSRAERLAIAQKKLDEKEKKAEAGRLRRRLKEAIKYQETEDELREGKTFGLS